MFKFILHQLDNSSALKPILSNIFTGGYHTFHATCKDFGEQVRILIYMLVAIFVI